MENESKGINKFDSIPVEMSDIVQAAKIINLENPTKRKRIK